MVKIMKKLTYKLDQLQDFKVHSLFLICNMKFFYIDGVDLEREHHSKGQSNNEHQWHKGKQINGFNIYFNTKSSTLESRRST